MYCDQRSQYIRLNSKKNSFRGNYSRKYGSIILIYFLKYETIVSINGLFLGYSERDTISVDASLIYGAPKFDTVYLVK